MEKEYFFSGYCRTLDKSRMVAVETEDGKVTDVDCCFENCIHAPNCTIAQEIRKLSKDQETTRSF